MIYQTGKLLQPITKKTSNVIDTSGECLMLRQLTKTYCDGPNTFTRITSI